MTDREKMIDLIINAKKSYPETGSFTEYLADFLLGYGIKLPDPTPQPGKPLTLEQLREMDGQPAWCEDVGRWAIVSVDNVGEWKGVPFALFMENGAKFNWNVEVRKLTLYSYPPAHIDRSGWISFKKRLPKTGTVLVTDGKIVITAPSSSVTKDGLAITHWMPLPEPPEEVQL